MRILLFLLLGLSLTTCSLLDSKEKDAEVIIQNPIYASVFLENTVNGSGKALIAIEKDNPSIYKVITKDTFQYTSMSIAPDGQKIIFSDSHFSGSIPILGMYDIAQKTDSLLLRQPDGNFLIGAKYSSVIWNTASTGFFFTSPVSPYHRTRDIRYFNLHTGKDTTIKEVPHRVIYPLDRIGEDTLLVRSDEFGSLDYYLMNFQGEYICAIKTELIMRDENGTVHDGKIFNDVDWNDSLQLLASDHVSDQDNKLHIAIADINGSYFKVFSDTTYSYYFPRWIDDGNIIFARKMGYDESEGSELMHLDPETEEVTLFFSPKNHDEIRGVGHIINTHY